MAEAEEKQKASAQKRKIAVVGTPKPHHHEKFPNPAGPSAEDQEVGKEEVYNEEPRFEAPAINTPSANTLNNSLNLRRGKF